MPSLESKILSVIQNKKALTEEPVSPQYIDLGGPITSPTQGGVDYTKGVPTQQLRRMDKPEVSDIIGKKQGDSVRPVSEEDDEDDKDEKKEDVNEESDDEEKDDDKKDVSEEADEDDKDDKKEVSEESDDDEDDSDDKKKEVSEEADDEDDKKDEVDEEADEDEKDEDPKVDVKEDTDALFRGEKLTKAFRTKAVAIFEAAIAKNVKADRERLKEKFERKLAKRVEQIKEQLAKKTDVYLRYVSEAWLKENKLAYEASIKAELVEDFIAGLQSLFQEHYIEIPKDKVNVVEQLVKQNDELKKKLNEQIDSNITLRETVNRQKRAEAFAAVTEGLTVVQTEKLRTLSEGLTFNDEKSFKAALKTLRENYFAKPAKKAVKGNAQVSLTEDVTTSEELEQVSDSNNMSAYLKSLNRFAKN